MIRIVATVEIRTRAARAWVVLMSIVARIPFVSIERAARWAVDGGYRLTRYRMAGDKRWRRFSREDHRRACAAADNRNEAN